MKYLYPYFLFQITYVDFHLYEMICAHAALEASTVTAYPKLLAYKQRFEVSIIFFIYICITKLDVMKWCIFVILIFVIINI